MMELLALILGLIAFEYLLETVADLLNLRALDPRVPAEFQDLYDAEKYSKSQEYSRANTRLALTSRTVLTAGTVAFLLAGGFNWVDQFARRTAEGLGQGTLTAALVFAGTLSLIKMVARLPFSLHSTFRIEERFGFNRTTPRVFVQDMLKGLVLGVLLGAPLFAGVVHLYGRFESQAWLYAWLILISFQLILTFLAPVLILPLFNKFDPIPDGELKRSIEEYARRQGFRIQGIFTMNGSKRSTKANAFFTGFGRFRRIVLFDTLIERHSVEELTAVLAHEIGHFKRRHIPKFTVLSMLSTGVLLYALSYLIAAPALYAAFGMAEPSVYAGIIFASMLYGPVLRVLSIFTQMLSRKFEYEADRYAVETYGRPEILASALKKLSRDSLSNLTPHPLKVLLDYSHPPVLSRVKALRAMG